MGLGKQEEKIYSLVTVSNMTSIDEIAATLGIGFNKTIKIIKNMINEANTIFNFVNDAILFKNAQIDYKNNKIILDTNLGKKKNQKSNAIQSSNTTQVNNTNINTVIQEISNRPDESVKREKIISCKRCGADNAVVEGGCFKMSILRHADFSGTKGGHTNNAYPKQYAANHHYQNLCNSCHSDYSRQ